MKHNIKATFFIILPFFCLCQEDTNQDKLTNAVRSQLDDLRKGDIKGYIAYFDVKNFVHLHGGINKDGKVNFKKYKKRLKKMARNSKSALYTHKERPLDSLYDFKRMRLSDYHEILQKNGKMDMYGFSLEKGDYLVMVPPYKRNSEGWWGIYRQVKERWVVIAGDL
ncbi:hypothetical protein [Aquimarina aquimarini]|uniref:hypothetical protein n=1 Tax=Aquimarina aquimarini TaxID=1191734 RepID=UPI000D55D2C1|nr:hypothetical protein [Aquimarina aquimarini]